MKPTLLLGVTLLGLLSGCAQKAAPGDPGFITECSTGPDQTCRAGSVCTVNIAMNGHTPVLPRTVFITGNGPVHIVWGAPPAHGFVAARQDGVWIKPSSDDQNQFADNFPTDDASGVPGDKKKGRHYHWRFDNTVRSTYDYSVQFRKNGSGGQAYLCDPRISNQGA